VGDYIAYRLSCPAPENPHGQHTRAAAVTDVEEADAMEAGSMSRYAVTSTA